eukprot:TRINITY_DN22975_c0_g1_i1.p1 TRINITY_DN22975_c0_g1~~TRINITY_DN22975_c0_g1_i1.p1  ORF type:complete len:872 (-),score=83.52 TRINITY_DN22975_c0_g1_i1:76-2691(-)
MARQRRNGRDSGDFRYYPDVRENSDPGFFPDVRDFQSSHRTVVDGVGDTSGGNGGKRVRLRPRKDTVLTRASDEQNMIAESRECIDEDHQRTSRDGSSQSKDGGAARAAVSRKKCRDGSEPNDVDRSPGGGDHRRKSPVERTQLTTKRRSAHSESPHAGRTRLSESVSPAEPTNGMRRRRRRLRDAPSSPSPAPRREPTERPRRRQSKEGAGVDDGVDAQDVVGRRSRSARRRKSSHGRSFRRQRTRSGSCNSRRRSRGRRTRGRTHHESVGRKPEGCRSVWIGWMDKRPAEEDIIDFFKDAGKVTEVRRSDRHVRGHFAHVQFEDINSVDAAMKKSGELFNGEKIQIEYESIDKSQSSREAMTNPTRDTRVRSRGRNSTYSHLSTAANNKRYRPKSVKPPNGHTLWIGDLSTETTEQDLIDLFNVCGRIEVICLQLNQLRNGQFGHVKFYDTESVDKAAELGGTMVKGVPIRVDFTEDKPATVYRVGKDAWAVETSKPEDCRTVWIGGLPQEVTEASIREVFEPCGEIKEIRLDKSRRSGASFCHVEFVDSSSVDRAVRISGCRIMNAKIRVDFAESRRPDHPSGQVFGEVYGWPSHGCRPVSTPSFCRPPLSATEIGLPAGELSLGTRLVSPRPASVVVESGTLVKSATGSEPSRLLCGRAPDEALLNLLVPQGPPRPPRKPDGLGCPCAAGVTSPSEGPATGADANVTSDIPVAPPSFHEPPRDAMLGAGYPPTRPTFNPYRGAGPPLDFYGVPPPGYYGGIPHGHGFPPIPPPLGYYGAPPPHYHAGCYEYWRPPGRSGDPPPETAEEPQGSVPKPSQAGSSLAPTHGMSRSESVGSGSYYSYSSYSYSPSRSQSPKRAQRGRREIS